MNFVRRNWLFILGILLIVYVCSITSESKEIQRIKAEREQLKASIGVLIGENQKLLHQLSLIKKDDKPLTFTYLEPLESKRFIPVKLPLLVLPQDGTQILREINQNTVVEVLDFVDVNGEVWLYISVPVFDSSMNRKGWIKEEHSELYTLNKQELVESPIYVNEGTNVYKVDLVTEIYSVTAEKILNEQQCFISDKQEEYFALGCGGDISFIIKKSEIIYPSLE